MLKKYNGLEVYKIQLHGSDIATWASPGCSPMIQLAMVDGVCVSDPSLQQVEYVGNNGGED